MTKLLKTCKPFDIIAIPFPFSDKLAQKKRPALVVSSEKFNRESGHLVTAMITTAKKSRWPLDTLIQNTKSAGLPVQCLIRMKFYTVDQNLVLEGIGTLGAADRKEFTQNLSTLFKP